MVALPDCMEYGQCCEHGYGGACCVHGRPCPTTTEEGGEVEW